MVRMLLVTFRVRVATFFCVLKFKPRTPPEMLFAHDQYC